MTLCNWVSRGPSALFLVLVVYLLLAAPSAAKVSCKRSGSTVLSSKKVRVFKTGTSERGQTYACWRRTGRVTWLGPTFSLSSDTNTIDRIQLRGAWVSYVERATDRYGACETSVFLLDVRAGTRQVFRYLTCPELSEVSLSLVGTTAWNDRQGEVSRTVALGRDTSAVVDDAPGVGFGSAAVAGARVYWMRAGVAYSKVIS
jgi:hypothetical protein